MKHIDYELSCVITTAHVKRRINGVKDQHDRFDIHTRWRPVITELLAPVDDVIFSTVYEPTQAVLSHILKP